MTRLLRAALLSCCVLALSSCEWFTDFKSQPSVKPWQPYRADSAELKGFRGQPANSVSTNGTLAPGYGISNSPNPATVDSFSTLANPTHPDERSLANGRMYYSINCSVCHGDLGDANSALKQLNPQYGLAPSLLTDQTKNRTDGYIWGMIRNGRGLMPTYNRIEEMDRWDVVNYVRGLQGKLPAPVATGPVGLPGETGTKLPGATRLGPTQPSRYAHDVAPEKPEVPGKKP